MMNILTAVVVTILSVAGLGVHTEVSNLRQQIEVNNLKYRTLAQSTLPAVLEEFHDEVIADVDERLSAQSENVEAQLGASNQLPTVQAFYEDALASRIDTTATSFTLVRGTDPKTGTALASSTYMFVLSEGSPNEEIVMADCTGTACSNVTRGISPITGTSTVTALKREHRRGDSVKITDAALVLFQKLLGGLEGFRNPLIYSGVATTTLGLNENNLASVEYVNDAAFTGGGVIAASDTARGFVEMSTGAEAAASTATGATTARLALGANLATSTRNSATAANRVVVTGSDGYIDPNFNAPYRPPIGSLLAYASSTAPDGWLAADGSAVSRTTYANLFAVVGTTYGVGNGATTFNLPDLRGRYPVMASSTQAALQGLDRATIGATGTTTSHTLTEAQLPAHDHDVNTGTGGAGSQPIITSGTAQFDSNGRSTEDAGSNAAFNILDPYIVVNYIIKY